MDKIYCPVNGWDCPYFNKDCSCALPHPEEDCDDFMAMDECFEDESKAIWVFGAKEDVASLLEEGYHIVNDVPMKLL